MLEEPRNHAQFLQQAIATTITCRTIIKYNSNLSPEQKEEILQEIEGTLTFLEERLAMHATLECSPTLSPDQLADLLAEPTEAEEREPSVQATAAMEKEELTLPMQSLYRLYHAYLSNRSGKGIAALETRYKNVMSTLDQLQELAGRDLTTTAGDITVEELILGIQGFVTSIYYMFREFAALFAHIVEGKNIDIDTEAMELIQKYPQTSSPQLLMRDITPLLDVYSRHRQLQERRGALADCVADAAAFLTFLQEHLNGTTDRHEEIKAQLKVTISLFHELTGLLMDYEQAMINIIQAPSTSP